MKIKIGQPYALNEVGKRENNEDSIYPSKGAASTNDKLFLVCDGIGGHQGGEIASGVVCRSFAGFLGGMVAEFNESVFQRALDYAYEQLDEADNDGQLQKMGTTLTFLYLSDAGAFMAHIGDSRIYHLRSEGGSTKIVYKSQDHSLVNDLLRSGIITEEEARHHPKKNVITRAMQPHQEKPAKAEVYQTADVQPGDYFFLCSDGILESVDDAALIAVMASGGSNKEKMGQIHRMCREQSRDNFSAYLVPVTEVSGSRPKETTSGKTTESATTQVAPKPTPAGKAATLPNLKKPQQSRGKLVAIVSVAAIITLLVAGGIFLLKGKKTTGSEAPSPNTEAATPEPAQTPMSEPPMTPRQPEKPDVKAETPEQQEPDAQEEEPTEGEYEPIVLKQEEEEG